jgi:drug/metabolite transporter (DMT)-like permease
MNPATQTENYRNQPMAGALCVFIASFVFAILGALVKVVSSSIPNEMVVFFRNICALIFILPWYWYSRPFGRIRTNFFQIHLLRSITG